MIPPRPSRLALGVFLLAVSGSVRILAQAGAPYEPAPTFRASEILPPELRASDHHEVIDEIASDGYMLSFKIASDFGRFEAYGRRELAERVREIHALAELDRLSRSDVFLDAAGDAAAGVGKAAEQLVEDPEETIKQIPKGVGRMFKRIGRTAERGYESAKEKIEDDREEELADDAADGASELFKVYAGVTAAERQWAQKLGTDPYTSNRTLAREIKKIAKVSGAASLTVRVGLAPIPGVAEVQQLNMVVFSKDPEELRKFNRGRLAAVGAAPSLVDAFFRNPWFSPTRQTRLVTALAGIEGAENRAAALEQAALAESEAEARFLVESAEMLLWFHNHEAPVTRLLLGERVLIALASDAREVMMAPVDHVSWTEGIAEIARRRTASRTAGIDRRELYLLGDGSERCRSELQALGWSVRAGIGDRISDDTRGAIQ